MCIWGRILARRYMSCTVTRLAPLVGRAIALELHLAERAEMSPVRTGRMRLTLNDDEFLPSVPDVGL